MQSVIQANHLEKQPGKNNAAIKTTAGDSFAALLNLLGQSNQEIVANQKQNGLNSNYSDKQFNAIKSPGTPEDTNQPLLQRLKQNLINDYSADNNKTWNPLSINLLQFLDSQLNSDISGSQKQSAEETGTEKPGKLLDSYTFTALLNLLGQLNPEMIANQQQNQPQQTPKEVNESVLQYLTKNLGLDTQDTNQLTNNYSIQSKETWGPLSTNLLQFLESQFNPDSISSQKQGTKETGSQPNKPSEAPDAINKFVLQYLTQSPLNNYSAQNNKTWGKSSKNILTPLNIHSETEASHKETLGKSINISNLLRFINDTKKHAGQLEATSMVNTALGTKTLEHQSGQHQEGNNQGISKGNVVLATPEDKSEVGKAGVLIQGTQERSKLVPGMLEPNRKVNRGKSVQNTLPKEQVNIQNAFNDEGKATRIVSKPTVNQSPGSTTDYVRENPNQQQSQKSNDSSLAANKSESVNQQTAATTTTIKEVNTGNKDNQILQQIQLQPGRESSPGIQQNLSNTGISQQVQLAARVAPLIQQVVSNNKGTTSLHLKLKPEHLGEVTIRLVYNQGSLQAHFVAANAHARELLDQSMVHLKENLLQLNINLNDASTSSGDESNKWGQQSPFQQKQHRARENEPSLMSPEELIADDPLDESEISENRGLNHLV